MHSDKKIETLKEGTINLWRICFNDTEEFIRFYFERKYKDENTIGIEENGQIVSVLQMLPYTMTWNQQEVPVSYISGASTHPDARNKGLMQKLLTEAFFTMKNRKFIFSILIPQEDWLYDYYSQAGYAPVFRYTSENYYLPVYHKHPAVTALTAAQTLAQRQELYKYFNRNMLRRPNCVQHSSEDFDIILEDLYLSGGSLLVFRHPSGQPGGMAFTLPTTDNIRINELLYDSEEEKSALLNTAAGIWHTNEISCKVPARSGHSSRRGMVRIIDARQVLGIYAANHPHQSVLLFLSDKQLPFNNGYYRLKNGQVFRTGAGVQRPDLSLDIQELTQLVFHYPAYISLMLD